MKKRVSLCIAAAMAMLAMDAVATIQLDKQGECTITFNKNGGSGGTSSVKATFGEAMPSITVPTRTGYKFEGYKSGDGTRYYLASGVSACSWDINAERETLFAEWLLLYHTW